MRFSPPQFHIGSWEWTRAVVGLVPISGLRLLPFSHSDYHAAEGAPQPSIRLITGGADSPLPFHKARRAGPAFGKWPNDMNPLPRTNFCGDGGNVLVYDTHDLTLPPDTIALPRKQSWPTEIVPIP